MSISASPHSESPHLVTPHPVTPDPDSVGTVHEFVQVLRAFKTLSGASMSELHRRTGLPRSTVAHTLDPDRPQLPPLDRVLLLIQACGVPPTDQEPWAQAWRRIQLAPAPRPTAAAPDRQQAPPAPPGSGRADADPGPARRKSRYLRLLTHTAAGALGAVIGAGAFFAMPGTPTTATTAGTPVQAGPCPAAAGADGAALHLPRAQPSDPTTTGAHPIAWIARPAYDAQILTATGVVLPVTRPVAEGNALIVTLMLTSTCPGPVAVTDTRADQYRIVGDVTDTSRHRTMILAALHVRALSTADSLQVSYPRASKYHIAVDEFHGPTIVVTHAEASGPSGGTAFTTSSTQLPCAPGDLLFSTVGTNTGTAPAFAAGWTTLPVLKLSSYRLTTAYQLARAEQPCAATGTTTAQWGAVLVILR